MDWLLGRGKWAPAATQQESRLNREVAASVNNVFAIPSMVANAVSGGIESLKRPVVTAFSGDWGAAGADLRAQMLALGDAFADFGATFRTGLRPSRAEAVDQAGKEAFLGKDVFTSEAWRVAFLRTMSATDEFYRHLNAAGAEASRMVQLWRQNPNLTQAEVLQKFSTEILDAGERAAAESVFAIGGTGVGKKFANWRAGLVKEGASAGERALGLITNVLAPFSSVPDVILTQGVKRLPGINEAVLVGQLRSSDSQVRQRAIASAVLGEVVNGAIWVQVQEGNITGNGPTDPDKKRAVMDARDKDGNPIWQPNSMRIGGRWFPYSSLGPVAVRMGAIANMVEQLDEESKKPNPSQDQMERIAGTAGALIQAQGETVGDAWYLQTVGMAFNAMKYGGLPGFVGRLTGSTILRGVPYGGEARSLEPFIDPTMRETGNPLDAIAAAIPGLSQFAQPKIDPATGRPIERPQDVTGAVVRSTAPGAPNRVNELLGRHNLGVGEPGDTVSVGDLTIPITAAEKRQLMQLSGPEIERGILALDQHPDFAGAPRDVRRELLQDMIKTGREVGSAKFLQTLSEDEIKRRIVLYEQAQREQAKPGVRLTP